MARTRILKRVSRYEDRWMDTRLEQGMLIDWDTLEDLAKAWDLDVFEMYNRIDRALKKRRDDEDFFNWATRGAA